MLIMIVAEGERDDVAVTLKPRELKIKAQVSDASDHV